MSKEPDFDIDKYDIDELLDIFNITKPLQKEAIMKIAGEFIDKYKQLQQSQYVEFFSKAMNKLVSNYHQVEDILGKVNHILDDTIETTENIKHTIDDIQENAEDIYDDFHDRAENLIGRAEDIIDDVQEKTEDIYEQGVNAYNDAKKFTNDFINPEVEDAGPNILRNMYYNANTGHERAGNFVMPPRGNYISVPDDPGVNQHAQQLQQRLMMPNAFAQIPYAQGYRNPTLQNAYITWVNVDSQYREIKPTSIESTNCSNSTDPSSNDIIQNDSSTDFLFTLQSPITNVLAMTVGSIEIPLSGYYAFSDKYGNTTFEIQVTNTTNKNVSSYCLRIPEGNYDAPGITTVINAELGKLWKFYYNNTSPYPHLFINASDQKAYFAFSPKNPEPNINVTIVWFNKSRCGCCNDCCDRNKNILESKQSNWPPSAPFYNESDDPTKKEYICSDNNTGKKINSTLGWSLGFRQAQTKFQNINKTVTPVVDASLNDISGNTYYGAFGSSVWNELGTKYFILEIDDYNRNRNTGHMGTMTLPSSTEKFKLPSYAKELSQIYPVCNEKTQTPADSTPEDWPHKHPNPLDSNKGDKNRSLQYTTNNVKRIAKGNYENFKRASRKGTQGEEYGIKGQDTLTKAQKYTAKEISNARINNGPSQYFAPQASNILFRFPVERLSSNPQAPLIVPNTAGMANGRRYFGPVTIEKLRVRLLDDKGYPVDLHLADISFSLIMERLYQY